MTQQDPPPPGLSQPPRTKVQAEPVVTAGGLA